MNFTILQDFEDKSFVINLDTIEVIRHKSNDEDIAEIHCVSGGIYEIKEADLEKLLRQLFGVCGDVLKK